MLDVETFAEFFANLAYFSAIAALSQNAGHGRLQLVDSAGNRERLQKLPR